MPSFSKIKRKILIAGEISLDVSSHACNLEFDKAALVAKKSKEMVCPSSNHFPK
jgi:hypothetical protein